MDDKDSDDINRTASRGLRLQRVTFHVTTLKFLKEQESRACNNICSPFTVQALSLLQTTSALMNGYVRGKSS